MIWPNQDNDTYTVLKFFHSRVPVPLGLAKAFCAQEVKVLNYSVSDNSDLLKKAFLYLLSRIPGEMWMTQALGQKSITKVKTNSDGEMKWDPSPEELRAGIEHINNHAPLANAKNEQFLWSLLNIRDKDCPICGWPLHIVGKACGNRATGNSQSEPEYFFPLLLRDLNSEFQRTVVPMILPTLLSFGLIILGKPGIGKTPAAIIIMVMAVARYLIQTRNMDGYFPGWRRSKQIDGFRERPGEIHIPVILGDPLLPSINVEDIKSFLDVGENGLVDALYRAAKFVRNQCRVLLNNEWSPEEEPEYVGLPMITWKQFLAMFQPALNDSPMPHIKATLKRASVIIAGNNAIYVRLASEHQSQKIHCINNSGITEDWLQPTNKPHYDHYKKGQHTKYQDFDRYVEEETDFVSELLASPEEKEYLRRGATYDRWTEGDFTEPDPMTPRPSTPAMASNPSDSVPGGMSASPLITSPPAKQARIDMDDPDAARLRGLIGIVLTSHSSPLVVHSEENSDRVHVACASTLGCRTYLALQLALYSHHIRTVSRHRVSVEGWIYSHKHNANEASVLTES